MRLLTTAIVLSCLAVSVGAQPQIETRKPPIVLATWEVTHLVRAGADRVLAGVSSKGAWLAYEKLDKQKILWQLFIRSAAWGKTTVVFERDVTAIHIASLRDGVLAIKAHYEGRDWLSCTVNAQKPNAWTAVCNGTYTGTRNTSGGNTGTGSTVGGGVAKPRVPSMMEIEAVTIACSDAFRHVGPNDVKTCVDHVTLALKGPFWASAAKVPGACSNAFKHVGPGEIMKCVVHARAARREPIAVVQHCEKSFRHQGPGAVMSCVAEWTQKT